MIHFKNLSLRRGDKLLFKQANGVIHIHQKVGIVGANGCGKSSLFNLFDNTIQPDHGELEIPLKLNIAYVRQETPALKQLAIEFVMDGDEKFRQLQQQIEQHTQEKSTQHLAESYAAMQDIDGYSAQARAAQLMHGLGFDPLDEQRTVDQFSGGWRMRLNLAQALMKPSDLLLLDEPTNHLDIEAVLWLENWLKKYKGTLLVISHDREFLDAVIDHVIHIDQQNISFYTGNYSDYETIKASQLATQQAQYQKQQKKMQHMQQFIDRFRYKASKAKQAQARIKALNRMEKINAAQLDSPFYFTFPESQTQTHQLLKLEKAHLGYDKKIILEQVDLIITPKDRIGLLGQNGSGKSTLIKSLHGDLTLLGGERSTSKNLRVGYFAQHQLEQLDLSESPLRQLQKVNPDEPEQKLRDFLGGFNFHDEQINKSVRHFSGGEKARLVLAILVYQSPDLILLDEPTNHLDIKMRHALSMALQTYNGAVVLVSHDRHLLNTVADRWVLVEQGKIRDFNGNLDDYHQHLKRKESGEKAQKNAIKEDHHKNERKSVKPLKNKLQKLERQMNELSKIKIELEEKLNQEDIYLPENSQQLQKILQAQDENQKALKHIESEWLSCSEQLEELSENP